jgi:hypothetical protein
LLEVATTPEPIAKLLAKHGLGPRPPPPRPAPTGQLRLPVRSQFEFPKRSPTSLSRWRTQSSPSGWSRASR